jgi:hypothetical protein
VIFVTFVIFVPLPSAVSVLFGRLRRAPRQA